MVAKTNSHVISKEEQALIDRERNRAARQALKPAMELVSHEQVECVVLPAGHGKISMGIHVPGIGEAHYEEGEKFPTGLPTALELYQRGFVNFEGARDALAERNAKLKQQVMADMAERAMQLKALEQAGLA